MINTQTKHISVDVKDFNLKEYLQHTDFSFYNITHVISLCTIIDLIKSNKETSFSTFHTNFMIELLHSLIIYTHNIDKNEANMFHIKKYLELGDSELYEMFEALPKTEKNNLKAYHNFKKWYDIDTTERTQIKSELTEYINKFYTD